MSTSKHILILLKGIILCSSLFGQTKETPLKITHLKGDFYVFTTYNIYKNNRVSSNGLYLVTGKGVVMIDTPWDTTQFQPLLDSIEHKHNKKVVLCIATHSHEDRTAGLEYLKTKGVRTYTSKQTDEISKIKGEKRAEYHFLKDTVFLLDKYSIQTFYAGEAHTKDNIFIWFKEEKVLYGGCAIKSSEAIDLGNIKEANLNAWSETLRKVKQKFKEPEFIIPGHQDWTSLKSIDHTLDLLKHNGN